MLDCNRKDMLSLPNLLTLLNLICGSLSIYGIFYESEFVTIFFFSLALIFDFLDGFAARLLGQTSALGRDLDSLADLISFGLFPTFLLVDLIDRSLIIGENPIYGLVFILVAGAGLRLATFNQTVSSSPGFAGIPTPAMAMIVFAIWINTNNPAYPGLESLANPVFILILALVLTLVMNLPIPFIKFSLGKAMDIHQIFSLILILIGIVVLFFNWRLAVLITILAYCLFSLLLPLLQRSSSSPTR